MTTSTRSLRSALVVLLAGLLGGALATGLSGCTGAALRPAADPQARWVARQADLGRFSRWHLTGRVAIMNDAESWHATLDWQQRDDGYEIRFIAPLGQGTVRLHGDRSGVVMETTDGQVRYATDADSLMLQQIGWPLPVAGLFWWVRGLPDPAVAATPRLDDQGRLANLDQKGWQMEFRRYTEGGSPQLPEKIFMHNRDIQVRLIIDEWKSAG